MDIYKKVKELVEMMKEADLDAIEIKDGLREIKLTRHSADVLRSSGAPLSAAIPAYTQALPAPAAAPAAASPPARDENLTEFKSPMVGTFYRAPSPESPPYVSEGDRVTKDSVVCIIEAMKVMNEIKSEHEGEVVEVLVENGEAVEFGQPLLLIRTTR